MVRIALTGLVVSIVVLWVALATALYLARPRNGAGVDLMGSVPKVARLVWSLAHDRSLPRTVRWRLWFAFAYCVQPINLIPDFIPVIGFVDNIVILTWALRSTVNRAGNDTVIRNWTGTHDELASLYRIMHINPTSP